VVELSKFKFKIADGRHIGKCCKTTTRLPMDRFGWSHPIVSLICPPWCGCHGNFRCLATAHWTLSSYGHLKAERVNRFRRNLVYNSNLVYISKLGTQWQPHDRILKLLKFNVVDGRSVGKYWKCHNSPANGFGRNLSGRIPLRPRHVRHDAVAMATAAVV